MKTETPITRIAEELSHLGQQQITHAINDRITRAFLLKGDAHIIALDTNARLITHLHEKGIWAK